MKSTQYLVTPVVRSFKLLHYIAQGNKCVNLSLAAKEIGINRTTLLRLLHTLLHENIIEKQKDGYQLGTNLITMVSSTVFAKDLVQTSQPVLEKLSQQLNLSAHLGVLEGREVVYLARVSPNTHLVSNVRVGSRMPAHAITIGRAILSHLTPSVLEEMYQDVELVAVTKKTATTFDALKRQLQNDKEEQLAWSLSNYEQGIGSCGCAIFDYTEQVKGGINVTGLEQHFSKEKGRRAEIANVILEVAQEISQLLGSTKIFKNYSKK